MTALTLVNQLCGEQCWIAAGFVRNLVWDALHDYTEPTSLNDIDVVYFDDEQCDPKQDLSLEALLKVAMPALNWQVRNQARMHERNKDRPYTSVVDAMRFWPEKETAVAVRLTNDGELEWISSWGFDSLFRGDVTYNPARPAAVFLSRVENKQWLTRWPKLRLQGEIALA
nr:nucleotidyltransferase family protein [Thaumasiovibrio subtropicus]